MTDANHSELISAVQLVLQHGSLEAAVRQGRFQEQRLYRLVDRAIELGYLTNAKESPVKAPKEARSCVLFVGDIHIPYEHPDALAFIMALRDKHKPTDIILAGDELDVHSLSSHPTDPNGQSPGDELEMSLERIQAWYKEFPVAKVCVSNHGSRPYRKAFLSGIPSQYLREYRDFMRAPKGWEWRDDWQVSGVNYSHGESASGPNGVLQLAIRSGKSQACGHFHGSAGASFFHNGDKTVFGLYSGCLISDSSFAFRYGKHSKFKPIIGSAIVEDGIPTFIPMPMNQHKRWTGKLK